MNLVFLTMMMRKGQSNWKAFTMLGILVASGVGGTVLYNNLTPSDVLLNLCTYTNETYYQLVPYNSHNITFENGTIEEQYNYTNQSFIRELEDCRQVIRIGARTIDTLNKGFVCSERGNWIICDSVRDGNGDGVCNLEGGETCCGLNKNNGKFICKNSEKTLKNTSINLPRLDA